uniref:Caspase family p20 domain-containing protein n=1 Tax=Homalodisca liturata TaxID=320908 RepID=A0A1B6HDM3_9HEMI
MEKKDRDKILSNMTTLVKHTHNFDAVFGALREERGMFNDFMVNEILSVEESNRTEYLYRYVTTRGPRAFRHLLNAFNKTDHNELASLLSSGDNSTRVFINGSASNELTLEDEYPYGANYWEVKKNNVTRHDWDLKQVYRMGSKPKGLALIINIRDYVNKIKDLREGSEEDVRRLKSTLEQLDYKVTICEDPTKVEILDAVTMFAKNDEHRQCDSCIMFVMSHGVDTKYTQLTHTVNIAAYDGQYVNSQDIISPLMPKRCKALVGKPKLIFFQCCRGDEPSYNVAKEQEEAPDRNDSLSHHDNYTTHTDGEMKKPPIAEHVKVISDLLIGYSTSPGFVSRRDPIFGSYYIQTLCQVLCRHARDCHIIEILTKVDNEISETTRKLSVNQTPTTSNCLKKKFYFQPGIYHS